MIEESVLRLFYHIKRRGSYRIAKRVYMGECMGSQSRKRWVASVNGCVKKRDLNDAEPGRMEYDRNE